MKHGTGVLFTSSVGFESHCTELGVILSDVPDQFNARYQRSIGFTKIEHRYPLSRLGKERKECEKTEFDQARHSALIIP